MTAPAYSAGQHLSKDPTIPPRVESPKQIAAKSRRGEVHPQTLDCSVEEYLLKRLRSAEEEGKYEEEALVQIILDNVLFYRGQHWLFATKDCQIDSMYQDDDDDDLVVHNWIGTHVDAKAKEWEASKPKIDITGGTHDYRLEGMARLAAALDRFTRKNSIKAHFRQSEAKFGMLCKYYYRRSILVKDESDENASRVQIPVTKKKKFYVGAAYDCTGCGAQWSEPDAEDAGEEMDALPSCEKCGAGPEMQMEAAPRSPYTLDVEVDVREEVVPTIRHESINPLLVKADHRGIRFQDGDYLILDTIERRYDLENKYEDVDLSGVASIGSTSQLPARLRAMLDLERTSSGVDVMTFGLSNVDTDLAKDDEYLRVRMFWQMPNRYKHKRARADEVIGGMKIKAGQRLGEVWPNGWLAVVIGDKEIALTENESKNKRWSGAPLTLDPTTRAGKGIEDYRSLQMSIDDKATLANSHFDRAGAPTEIIDGRIIDGDELDGDTGKRIYVKDTAEPTIRASEAVTVVQAGTLGSDFQSAQAAEPVILRELMGVSRGMVGMEDPNNKTARGQELAAAASSSLLIPALALRAEEVEVETTFQNLEWWQQFATEEDFAMFESEFGTEAIETFRNAKLRRDLNVEAKPGSWVPQTKDQEMASLEEFATKYLSNAQIMPGQPGLKPAFIRYAADLHNIPPIAFEPERDIQLAQARLGRLRQWAEHSRDAVELSPELYEAVLDQILMEPELQPNPLYEDHLVHIEFYAEQWKQMYDDKNVNPVLMDLIDKMGEAHYGAMAMAEIKKQQAMLKAQAPQIATDTAKNLAETDEQNAMEQDNADMQQARDSEGKQADQQMQSKAKNEDAVRQLAVTAGQQALQPAGAAT